MTYKDGVTPSLTYTFDRRGRQETLTQNTNSWKLFYTTDGQLLSESWTGGMLNGFAVTNNYDSLLRCTNLAVRSGSTQLTTNSYGYDLAGRLSTAADGSYSATYSYLANSPLASQITFKSNTTVRLQRQNSMII